MCLKQGVALTGRNRTGPPAALQTTDASQQNNTDPLGGPVITNALHRELKTAPRLGPWTMLLVSRQPTKELGGHAHGPHTSSTVP